MNGMTNGDLADLMRDEANAEEGARLHDEQEVVYTPRQWKRLITGSHDKFTIPMDGENAVTLKHIAQALVGIGLELRALRMGDPPIIGTTDDY
jgi:hypothetical protein